MPKGFPPTPGRASGLRRRRWRRDDIGQVAEDEAQAGPGGFGAVVQNVFDVTAEYLAHTRRRRGGAARKVGRVPVEQFGELSDSRAGEGVDAGPQPCGKIGRLCLHQQQIGRRFAQTPAHIVYQYDWTAPFPKTITYRVRKGDTLGAIASRHNVTVGDLKRWNKLRSNAWRPGLINSAAR